MSIAETRVGQDRIRSGDIAAESNPNSIANREGDAASHATTSVPGFPRSQSRDRIVRYPLDGPAGNRKERSPIEENSIVKSTTTRSLLVICTALLLAPGASAVWAADVAKTVETCTSCHGKDGASTEKDVPIIAGYSEAYLSESLGGYAKKDRPCPETKYRSGPDKGKASDMCKVAANLGDDGIKQVAKYFAGKKFVHANQSADPVLAKKGEQLSQRNCEKCHTKSGSDPSDDSGILAGQWITYLKQTLADFKNGKRPMGKKMKPKIDALQPADLDALANYYGSIK